MARPSNIFRLKLEPRPVYRPVAPAPPPALPAAPPVVRLQPPPPPPQPRPAPVPHAVPPSELYDVTPSGNRIIDVRDVTAYPGGPDRLTTDDGSPIRAVRFVDLLGQPVSGGGLPGPPGPPGEPGTIVHVGPTPPPSPAVNDLWVDTT